VKNTWDLFETLGLGVLRWAMRHSDEWMVDFRLASCGSGGGARLLEFLVCSNIADTLACMMGLWLFSSMDVRAFEMIGIDAAL
jgi:hypothetical protein